MKRRRGPGLLFYACKTGCLSHSASFSSLAQSLPSSMGVVRRLKVSQRRLQSALEVGCRCSHGLPSWVLSSHSSAPPYSPGQRIFFCQKYFTHHLTKNGLPLSMLLNAQATAPAWTQMRASLRLFLFRSLVFALIAGISITYKFSFVRLQPTIPLCFRTIC